MEDSQKKTPERKTSKMIIYENPSNDQFEWLMVEILKTKIDDFPCGNIDKHESPDFIIKEPNRTVGIEVTRAINQNLSGRTQLTAIRGEQFKCLKKIRKMLVHKSITPVEVGVKFRDDQDRINIDDTAQELFNYILKKIPNIDDTKQWNDYESGLKQISWISIHLNTSSGKKWLDEHRIELIHCNYVNTNPHEIIQKAIDPKNPKLAKYKKKCNECWLIIGVNELTPPEAITLLNNNDSTPYFSNFARTYFIRGVLRSVRPLNCVPSNTKSQ